MNPYVLGAAAVATDSCTGGLTLSWHCENDLDVTKGGVAGGVNNGCSAGDTTASAYSAATFDAPLYHDGSYGCDYPTTSDYHEFAYSSIFDTNQGTVKFWVYIETLEANTIIWTNYTNSSNFLHIRAYSTTQLRITHVAGGTAAEAVTTISGNLQLSTWYFVQAAWSIDKSGDSTNYLKICANTSGNTTDGCGVETDPLGTWAGTPSTIKFGNTGNYDSDLHLDNIRIYSAWQAF